uniref:Uncharacterized protein n=1 Tax=Chromera velia CCMP2878 TaxID=1169474 RepID=A0A0G4HSR1_9ALVE|eukprot:Cvel_31187.t1-p1 / transcript=Cvel_31187.t1 / gene=Cvel_31187 / organism=Chromera_velia_CCMP2878 / gene_product=hypothetical protein / transcript_product=hypothetical protein / location=Cvel_scaffold4598:4059-5180(-) / protein_length=374 / sequence_SO=supercontig / SO=protein_coding / is_pseudo=false
MGVETTRPRWGACDLKGLDGWWCGGKYDCVSEYCDFDRHQCIGPKDLKEGDRCGKNEDCQSGLICKNAPSREEKWGPYLKWGDGWMECEKGCDSECQAPGTYCHDGHCKCMEDSCEKVAERGTLCFVDGKGRDNCRQGWCELFGAHWNVSPDNKVARCWDNNPVPVPSGFCYHDSQCPSGSWCNLLWKSGMYDPDDTSLAPIGKSWCSTGGETECYDTYPPGKCAKKHEQFEPCQALMSGDGPDVVPMCASGQCSVAVPGWFSPRHPLSIYSLSYSLTYLLEFLNISLVPEYNWLPAVRYWQWDMAVGPDIRVCGPAECTSDTLCGEGKWCAFGRAGIWLGSVRFAETRAPVLNPSLLKRMGIFLRRVVALKEG